MNMATLTKTRPDSKEIESKDQEFKDKLLRNIKKQVKQIMEEAVTKKFVHEGSTSVLSLCASVEACLSHGLKRRVLGLFKSSSTAALLHKIAKNFEPAALVAKLVNDIENENLGRSSSSGDSSAKIKPQLQKSESTTNINQRFLWIKIALFQKLLAKIIDFLVQYASKYYEKDALISDPDYGPILSSLLVGPCALDYSKLKTQDHFWTDPPADELVQRHRISSGYFVPSTPNTPPNLKRPGLNYRRGISSSTSEDYSRPCSLSARDYVESLHQNNKATLLYGKNNVSVQPTPDTEPLAGYLSLHQCNNLLTIKWTPNQLMNGCCDNSTTSDPGLDKRNGSGSSSFNNDSKLCRKPQLLRQYSLPPSHPKPLQRYPSFIRRFSQDALSPCFSYWQYALNVQLQDIVYLHCHQEGDSCGTLVLVGQDGVQRPPIKFPVGGHLLAFLSCLETGLLPHGQLDPPLWSQRGKGKVFPKYKKKGRGEEEVEESDFVFRIVYTSKPTAMRAELLEMIASNSSKTSPRTPCLSSSTHTSSTSSSKSLSLSECSAFIALNGEPGNSEGSLQLVCVTMRKQIISRAFYGWLAHCRHLRTVRTHLSGLVQSEVVSPDNPTDATCGVTIEVWKGLHHNDCLCSGKELYRYTYFGGIDHSLRKEVWPYLLNHYSMDSNQEERDKVDKAVQCHYETTMSEWLAVEAIVSYRDKEITAANIAKLSSGSSCEAVPIPQEAVISNDVFEYCDDLSDLSGRSSPDDEEESKDKQIEGGVLKAHLENTIIVTRASNSESDPPLPGCNDSVLNCDDNDDSLSVSPASSQGGYSPELLESFGLNLHRIDKDVQRCDRNYFYFAPPENLDKLRNIMCTYVWENLEMGYVQGMCDLVAPLLVIFDDEAKTYSCFTHLMKRMAANFPHGGAMDNYFANMRSLIQILDSEMFELMHQNGDYTHFYFCYRWFLLDFKRELVYDDVFSVWECIWAAAQLSSTNFVLFIALALVQFYRDIILDNNMDFTDIIKFFNEMAERHEAGTILQMARDLVTQLQALIDNK